MSEEFNFRVVCKVPVTGPETPDWADGHVERLRALAGDVSVGSGRFGELAVDFARGAETRYDAHISAIPKAKIVSFEEPIEPETEDPCIACSDDGKTTDMCGSCLRDLQRQGPTDDEGRRPKEGSEGG